MTDHQRSETRAKLEAAIASAMFDAFTVRTDTGRLIVIDPAVAVDTLLTVAASIVAGADEMSTDAGRRMFAAKIADILAKRIELTRQVSGSNVVPFHREPEPC